MPGKRGGARLADRPDDRRKAKDGAKDLIGYAIRLTPYQRDKLKRLGGSLWVREQINRAPLQYRRLISLSQKGRDSLGKLIEEYLVGGARSVGEWEEALVSRVSLLGSGVATLVFPGVCTKSGDDVEIEFEDDECVWEIVEIGN